MKSLNIKEFELIEHDLKTNIVGCRINNISLINSRDYAISLSMIKDEKLLVSLNHSSPFVSLAALNNVPSTIVGALNDSLRKYVKDSFILNVSLLNKDRVFLLELVKSNELYEKEKFNLYIECIPQRPNLIITNEKNIVIYAAHYSSLNTNRPVVLNIEYQPLAIGLKNKDEEATTLKEIKQSVEEYYLTSLESRNKEKYENLFKFLKIRIKSLTKKLSTLDKSKQDAESKLNYSDVGNMLLAFMYDKEELEKYIADNQISIDSKLTIGQNAELYFKKYKKAKRTILMNDEEKEKALKEIEYLEFVLSSANYMSEEELNSLQLEYIPKKCGNFKIKKVPTFIGSIINDNTKISYGKNVKGNNELTFKIANKEDMYLHIKDFHGSHVVIHNSNPTKEQLLLASEIALLMSNKTSGDVYYTKIKNVKKGSSLGEALIKQEQLIVIKNIRENTKKLLK